MRAGTFLCIGLLLGLTQNNSETFSDEMREYFRESSWQVITSNGGRGSSIFIHPHLLLTNNHVLGGSDEVEAKIRSHDRALEFRVKPIKSSPRLDLTLLYCECRDYIPMIRPLATGRLAQGDRVYSAGYGLMRHLSMVSGVYQGEDRDEGGWYYSSLPSAPGDSGSGVIDKNLNIVGVRFGVSTAPAYNKYMQDLENVRVPVYHVSGVISVATIRKFLRSPSDHHNTDPYYAP